RCRDVADDLPGEPQHDRAEPRRAGRGYDVADPREPVSRFYATVAGRRAGKARRLRRVFSLLGGGALVATAVLSKEKGAGKAGRWRRLSLFREGGRSLERPCSPRSSGLVRLAG